MTAPGKLCSVTIDEVKVDGKAEIGFGKGKSAGYADLKIKVRVVVETINRAEDLERVLPGSTCIFHEGYRDAGSRPRDEDGEEVNDEPIGCHVQRTSFASELAWVLVGLGDTGPLDAPNLPRLEGEAKIRSLTLTASNGTVVLTVGLNLSVPVGRLPVVVALDGQRVRLLGRSNQAGLFTQPQGEPEAGPAEEQVAEPPDVAEAAVEEDLPPEAGLEGEPSPEPGPPTPTGRAARPKRL